MSANDLTASEAAAEIAAGRLTSSELVGACLNKIDETDGQIGAWAHLNREAAMVRAAECDTIRQSGRPMGPLHGVPVGLKDIIDTKTLPTERGTPLYAGRQPEQDAAVVDKLLDAGAVILGKTVTTELAFLHPSDTKNPANLAHTPGGSSSGSAAAVAAGQVPLALGTQTNGSVIRPAAFCGTFGFKPTRGMISRSGVLETSKNLDQVGVFARSLEDVALATDCLAGYDGRDSCSFARPRPSVHAGWAQEPPVPPVLVWFDLPYADRMTTDSREGFSEVVAALGGRVERLEAPETFAQLITTQRIIHLYEFCQSLDAELRAKWELVSPTLQPHVEEGRAISADQYAQALAEMTAAGQFFAEFYQDFDAIIAPSAAGEAPLIEQGTGDPVFCTIWTLCGLPAVTVPALVGDNGLPIGVQLIGNCEEDDRLMRTTKWVLNQLQQPDGEE